MCDCWDNPPLVFERITRRARKPKRCSECYRLILKGESYEHISGYWRDGGWNTYRWCRHCSAAEKVMKATIDGFCICFSALWEEAYECRRQYPAVARLTRNARRFWTYHRGPNAGELMPEPSVDGALNGAMK